MMVPDLFAGAAILWVYIWVHIKILRALISDA